jgi:hypothetical protein
MPTKTTTTALGLAFTFVSDAIDAGRDKPGGIIVLTKRQADWLIDLLRKEGLARKKKRALFGEAEYFDPVEDDTFWAQLISKRSDRGAARLQFRFKSKKRHPVKRRKK